jgi:probable F420-dependent oxidoreductase
MQLGFSLPMAMSRPELIAGAARRGEALGFDYVAVPDHTVIPRRIASRYPYDESGGFPGGAGHAMDQLAILAFLAAATTSIRLLTSVLVLPIRNPLVAANQLATIDVLSSGRLTVGCGIGWLREEFDAAGAPPFEQRARVSGEYIEAFRELWSSDEPAFEGEHVRFAGPIFEPKPVQRPSIPIWIGGEGPAARRRAGRLADGWYPISTNLRHPLDTIDRYVSARDEVWRHAEEAGREPESLAMTISAAWDPRGRREPGGMRRMLTGPPEDVAHDLEEWKDAGLDVLVLRLSAADPEQVAERLAEFAETVVPLR